jgi:hypothetical protein
LLDAGAMGDAHEPMVDCAFFVVGTMQSNAHRNCIAGDFLNQSK